MPTTTKKEATGYDAEKHQRSLAQAQMQLRDGKAMSRVEEWMPAPLADGTYGSSKMEEFCAQFAQLAAEIVNDQSSSEVECQISML
ncbi:hypothetical protein diail_7165 [Diaporthe ilicicola]|nr:hypothetical protein diail_7165 [Diaporthe ilicicola]